MPLDPRIPLGVTPPDPNAFTNALAAGMKVSEVQQAGRRLDLAENRLARKDDLATADNKALQNFLNSPRTPEDEKAYAAASPGGYLKTKETLSKADNNTAQAKNYQLDFARKNAAIVAEATGAMLANPTRENLTLILNDAEAKGADVSTPRKQLEKAPDEAIVGYIKGWAGTAAKVLEMDREENKAKPKPRWDSYNVRYVNPPGSAGSGAEPAVAPQAGPESAPGVPPGSPTGAADLTGTEDPTYRYFKTRYGLSDTGAFALARNITTESGHRTDVKGDGGKAQGLAQWHPDRYAKLEKWAIGQGLDPASKQAQMDYIMEEGKAYPGYESLKGNDPAAIQTFIKNFEGYGIEGNRFSGVDERAAQGGATAPPTDVSVPPASQVGGEPAAVDGPASVGVPPRQVYRSPAERDGARDAAADAKDKEAQRVANETLELKKETARLRRTQPTPQAAQKNREKLQTLDVIDARLDDVEAAFMGPKNPDGTRKPGGIEGSFSVGLAGGYLPSVGGRGYDATVDALRPFLRQISRTPGEGSMSDYETKQAEALLPARNDHPSVVKQKIQQIRNIVKQSRLGIAGSGAQAAGPTAPGPTPVQAAPLEDLNDMPLPGGKYKGKWVKDPSSGIVYRSDGSNWIKQ